MGNIVSFFHCCKCTERPKSLFGRKKKKFPFVKYPLTTPMHSLQSSYIFPLVAAESTLENNGNIIYNNNAPHLVTQISSPLNDHYIQETMMPTGINRL
jgi:hypothetical protein